MRVAFLNEYLHLFVAAVMAGMALVAVDFPELLAEFPSWAVGVRTSIEMVVLVPAVAALIALPMTIVLHSIRLLARRFVGDDNLGARVNVELFLRVGVAILVALPLVSSLVADLRARPGFLRHPMAEHLGPLLLPLALAGLAILLGAVGLESRRRRRSLFVGFGLVALATLAIYVDQTFFTGYYPLYHRALGLFGFMALWLCFSLLTASRPRTAGPIAREAHSTAHRFSWRLATAIATLFIPLFVWFAPILSLPGQADAILGRTVYLRQILQVLRDINDRDRDGFASRFGGADPNDADPGLHPLAIEIPGDGFDQDGDGHDTVSDVVQKFLTERREPASQMLPQVNRVFLITIDALRADWIQRDSPLDGRPITPTLRRFASNSLYYDHVYTPTARTRGSFRHILSNSYAASDSTGSFVTRLGEEGIACGLVSAQLVQEFLNPIGSQLRSFDRRIGALNKLGGLDFRRWGVHLEEPTSPATTDSALALTVRWRDRRSFLWIHYYDPHQWHDLEFSGISPSSSNYERYDRVMRFVDGEVARFESALDSLGLLDDAALIISSDHGEGLGDHGIRFHGSYVWNQLIRVPVQLKHPGIPARRVESPRSLLQLGPTILELFGIEREVDAGAHWLRPPSLRDSVRFAFSYDTEQAAVIDGQWKLIFNRRDQTFDLYDLAADPGEARDVSMQHPEVRNGLRMILAYYLDDLPFLDRLRL